MNSPLAPSPQLHSASHLPHAPLSSGLPAVFLGKPRLETWGMQPQVWPIFQTARREAAGRPGTGFAGQQGDRLAPPPPPADRECQTPAARGSRAHTGRGIRRTWLRAASHLHLGQAEAKGQAFWGEQHRFSCLETLPGASDENQRTNTALLKQLLRRHLQEPHVEASLGRHATRAAPLTPATKGRLAHGVHHVPSGSAGGARSSLISDMWGLFAIHQPHFLPWASVCDQESWIPEECAGYFCASRKHD